LENLQRTEPEEMSETAREVVPDMKVEIEIRNIVPDNFYVLRLSIPQPLLVCNSNVVDIHGMKTHDARSNGINSYLIGTCKDTIGPCRDQGPGSGSVSGGCAVHNGKYS